jgi:hypothetical protein
MLTLNILGTSKRRTALCLTCVYAVVQKTTDGEQLISCGYGGGLRELKLEVCECTVYTDARVPRPRRAIGYIQPEEDEAKQNITVIRIA